VDDEDDREDDEDEDWEPVPATCFVCRRSFLTAPHDTEAWCSMECINRWYDRATCPLTAEEEARGRQPRRTTDDDIPF